MGSGGMMFDAAVFVLLFSSVPSIPELVRMHVHVFGVPMCCRPPDNPSILEEIVIAIFSRDNGGLVWPRLCIVLLPQ